MELKKRLNEVLSFAKKWQIKGFRSEWLWRNEHFLNEISQIFKYDSSIPSVSSFLANICNNGCATALPYKITGDMTEVPISLPMDEERHAKRLSIKKFWEQQFERTKEIYTIKGIVNITLHPQPHQFANRDSLLAFRKYLQAVENLPKIWKTRPAEIVEKFNSSFH